MLLVESEWGSALILEAGPSSLCTDGVRWAAWLIDAGFDPTSLDLSDGREVEAALGEADGLRHAGGSEGGLRCGAAGR